MSGALLRQLRETAEMIKISHSVFALPFALAAAALAMRLSGGWSWGLGGRVVFCAIAARTAAMAMNRLVDARIDAENPRTAGRALPAGRVGTGFVRAVVVAASALFVLGAWSLNRLCLLLSPVALLWILGYPYAKRFTLLCHFWLGAALALAPVGAWLAVVGAFHAMATPLLLGGGVLLWTAGFDLIYACQDCEHDREAGLHSVPARLGIARTLHLSSLLHLLSVLLFALLPFSTPHIGALYAGGLAVAAALLVYEHRIVQPHDLSRVDLAFFTLNGCVSLVFGGATVADALL